jgi:hypothetical protein
VESEPASASSAVARLFSATPRFAADAPPSGSGLVTLAEPPEEVPGSEQPSTTSPAVAIGGSPAQATTGALRGPAAVEPASEADAAPTPRRTSSVPLTAPAVRATSTLELVYRNRLKNASLSVSVDGRRLYSGTVATPRGFINRTVGKNVWTSLDLVPGRHVVDVRVTGSEGKLDLVRRATATFQDGRTHRLRVVVTPFKKLKLNWKDSPGG